MRRERRWYFRDLACRLAPVMMPPHTSELCRTLSKELRRAAVIVCRPCSLSNEPLSEEELRIALDKSLDEEEESLSAFGAR